MLCLRMNGVSSQWPLLVAKETSLQASCPRITHISQVPAGYHPDCSRSPSPILSCKGAQLSSTTECSETEQEDLAKPRGLGSVTLRIVELSAPFILLPPGLHPPPSSLPLSLPPSLPFETGTQPAVQAALALRKPSCSGSTVPGLQICTTHSFSPSFFHHFESPQPWSAGITHSATILHPAQ